MIDLDSIKNTIQSSVNHPVTCRINKTEKFIYIDVFNVEFEERERIEYSIYNMERTLLKKSKYGFLVFLFSPKDTKELLGEKDETESQILFKLDKKLELNAQDPKLCLA